MLNRLKQETWLVTDQFRESSDGGFEVGQYFNPNWDDRVLGS
jgi:hypothetical protein